MLAKNGVKPFCRTTYPKVYPYLAAGVWALVMWLYECYPETLQPSLESSMRYLYTESNGISSGSWLPTAATAAAMAASAYIMRREPGKLLDLSARL
mmetsp:Transcript_71192/g.190067  ORF Transcript_71192/g.190067 Transcript_71192/m.190067 type:complete len:96 (-) Transcript_71192:455-742(-)